MFLKTLTLKGFKSFAEITKLEFQPGLTVVVGPNGSGKSNVVDAVAWVLGAQGPRTLRSSRMEDVIFAGSGDRPALGRAEVSLTIDNSSRLLPLELSEVTVTRTLFRNGDSEYALNGGPCRLLDVQELLSDAGVGRQQHVIVSQGHLDAVLESRPEGRRALIEEAAGVHKYRRRREKAERRLDATEEDLVRLQDLLREVRRQLRSLERQAGAARRQQALAEERIALRRHLLAADDERLRQELAGAGQAKAVLAERKAALEQAVADLQDRVAAAERPGSDAGDGLDDVVVAFERARGRARGLVALLEERRRSIQGQLEGDVEGRARTLETEQAGLEADLAAVDAEAAALAPRAEELTTAEAAVAAERAEFDQQWQEELPFPGGRAGEARGELLALRDVATRSEAQLQHADEEVRALELREEALADRLVALGQQITEATRERGGMEAACEDAESRRLAADAAVADLERRLAEARQEERVWAARAEALASFLESGDAEARRLSAVQGALGGLLDLVEVDEGWDRAFEAAIGSASSAMVLESAEAARLALDRVRSDRLGATLLPLGAGQEDEASPATVGAGHPLRQHVRSATPAVDGLLGSLLSRVVVVASWREGVDVVLARPELVAVTGEGDRFSAEGWRVGPSTAPTRAGLEEARSLAEQARAEAAAAEHGLGQARAEAEEAAAHHAELSARRAGVEDLLRTSEETLRQLEGERRTVVIRRQDVEAHVQRENERIHAERTRIAELEAALPALEADEAAQAEQARARQSARRRIDERVAAVATLRTDLQVRASALEERRSLLCRRQDEVLAALADLARLQQAAEQRRGRLQSRATATERLAGAVRAPMAAVESHLGRLHELRRQRQARARDALDHLERLRAKRASASAQLDEAREALQGAELREAELGLRLEALADAARRELDCELQDLAGAPCPELPPGVAAADRLAQIDGELRDLGPVNALALEDHRALEERHAFVEGQLEDVRAARRELGKVVRAIDAEITEAFAAAFADVAENFAKLFISLFPGGSGRLRLTDTEDLLGTGIEVEARPSGKRVGKLSLLSGGERSLTALAFMFAVFRSRPSPFYLLDEVEAALDDVNLHRFLELIDEFRDEAQLVIVTHQKRTMEAADCLFGVTMKPGGASTVVSERPGRRADGPEPVGSGAASR